MVNLIALHYQSGAEFFLNPDNLTGVERMPAANLTRMDVVGQYGAYKCIETPEEIQRLVNLTITPSNNTSVTRGVGVGGPVYGDGSEAEARSGVNKLDSGGSSFLCRGNPDDSYLAKRPGIREPQPSPLTGDDQTSW